MARAIKTDGAELATESFGVVTDRAVILIMGATASLLWWPDALCQSLADRGYFVIRYDNRDTGQSTTQPPGPPAYSVEDMAADLIAVMDGYGIARADIIGMSLGGLIGQIAALHWPERVRSLTLIGSEPLGWTGPELPGIAPAFLAHLATLTTLDWAKPEAVTAFMLEIARLSSGSGRSFDAARETRRIRAEIARARNIQSAFNHAMLALHGDHAGKTAEIAQPVLVLHGRDDPILPVENGQALAMALPNARLVILDGVGHELPPDIIPGLVDELSRFLAGTDQRNPSTTGRR